MERFLHLIIDIHLLNSISMKHLVTLATIFGTRHTSDIIHIVTKITGSCHNLLFERVPVGTRRVERLATVKLGRNRNLWKSLFWLKNTIICITFCPRRSLTWWSAKTSSFKLSHNRFWKIKTTWRFVFTCSKCCLGKINALSRRAWRIYRRISNIPWSCSSK